MNIHGVPQPIMGPGGMPNVGVSPGMMQQSSPQQAPQMQTVMNQQQMPQQQQQQPQPQQQAEKMDNISKIKSLVGPLRESFYATFKSAAVVLQQSNLSDDLKKINNTPTARYDKHLEEFYSICDQIELHLKTAVQCIQQLSSAQHYLPQPVASSRMEPYPQPENANAPISYPQYLATVRSHISSAKEIHDTLISAAQNISQTD
ncbi:unnamed protein product [Hermetia illucens]|uniref:Mediator of RNA polymerase II transcription subunit 29 n=1 Tax=Hermetia illucens TaxID=343691 RepID=A0A7R8V527_HERIL|nr:mediator of RNA polymerase II transcription subunit 29 [Hermetia illucens]CAD7092818.1 unnamed protein product [Hermetia illucens]